MTDVAHLVANRDVEGRRNLTATGVVYTAVDSDGKTASRDDGLPPVSHRGHVIRSDRPLGR